MSKIKLKDIENGANKENESKLLNSIDINEQNSINQTNEKLKDLNIFEMFKSDDEEENQDNNSGRNLIEKLESFNSKIKLTIDKMKKVDETNFKLSKETQDIKNAQDMNKRNILLNKKSIEEMYSKLLELENKKGI